MACNHERIKSENCVISCMICGKVLPLDYLVASKMIQAQNDTKTTEKPAPYVQTDKTPSDPMEAAETPKNGQKTGRKPRKGSANK